MRAYKNLGLTKKLFLSLMLIAALGVVIGLLGINSTTRLSQEDQEMYQYNTLPLQYLATMFDTLASQRICANNMVIFRETNPDFAHTEEADISEKEKLFDEAFKLYSTVLSDGDEEELYNNIHRLYYNDFKDIKANVKAAAASGDARAISDAVYEMDSIGAQISNYMDEAFDLNDKLASDKVAANQELNRSSTIILIVSMVIGALLAFLFAIFLSNIIGKPIITMSKFFVKFGTTGDLSLTEEDQKNVADSMENKDEIGRCINAAIMMVNHITEINNKLGNIADGDLAVDVKILSEHDSMGNALARMIVSLNSMFEEIRASTTQISTGSKQIADGAQSLAQGSTEQASAIEELSTSIGQISDKTTHNAGVAREAAELSGKIRESAEKGSSQMDQMMQSVKEINDASNQISKVIEVIDNIAFQTNILSLNAAVEAARAGQHGKGFAVVAEEVRSLAAKSAEAAKNTGNLIENSIEKANLGLNIAIETSASLKGIVEGINHSAEIVSQIAQSSDEQAGAISQINIGIDQVVQVIQQNSATAEESAAASQEMSGQSDMLEQLISQFKLRESENRRSFGEAPRKKALAMPKDDDFIIGDFGKDYGKY